MFRVVVACGASILPISAWATESQAGSKPPALQPVLVLEANDYVDHRQFSDGSGQALQREVVAWLWARDLAGRSARARSLALGLDEARASGCVAVLTPQWTDLKFKRRRVELAIALEWTGLQREPLARCEQRDSGEVADETEPDLAPVLERAVDRCLAQVYPHSTTTAPVRPLLAISRDLFGARTDTDTAQAGKSQALAELGAQLLDKQYVLLDGYEEFAGRGIVRLDFYQTRGLALSAAVSIRLDEVELSLRLRRRMQERAELELFNLLPREEPATSVVDPSRIADSDPLDRWITPIAIQLPLLTQPVSRAPSGTPIWYWVEIDTEGRATRIIALAESSDAVTAIESALQHELFTPGHIGGRPAPIGRLVPISAR
jgi:hypothetical protein